MPTEAQEGRARGPKFHVTPSSTVTPSKVRFEVENLLKQHLINEEDKRALLESAERTHVKIQVLDVCSKIREVKSRVEVGLIDNNEFRAQKKKMIEQLTADAAAAARRGRSYTRQIMATVAKKKEEELAQRKEHQEQQEKKQQHGGLGNEGHDQDGEGGDECNADDSSGDGEFDASVEFLREMGVELHPHEGPGGTEPAGDPGHQDATADHFSESSQLTVKRGDAVRVKPDTAASAQGIAGVDFIESFETGNGDGDGGGGGGGGGGESSDHQQDELPAWFTWNLLKREKRGHSGVVTNTNATQLSAQVKFDDELRFWFPLSLLERTAKRPPRETTAAADASQHQQWRAHDITGTAFASSWPPSAVAHFVQQLGQKRLWAVYARALLRAEVDGATLQEAEVADLVEYGVSRLHAKKILSRFKQAIQEEAHAGVQDEGAIFKYMRTSEKSVAYLEDVIAQVSADTQVELRAAEEEYTQALEQLNAKFQQKVVRVRDCAQLRLAALHALRKMVTGTVKECEDLWGLMKAGSEAEHPVSVSMQDKIEATLQRVKQLSNEQILKRVASIQAQ